MNKIIIIVFIAISALSMGCGNPLSRDRVAQDGGKRGYWSFKVYTDPHNGNEIHCLEYAKFADVTPWCYVAKEATND